MKALCSLAAFCVAFSLTACSLTQQVKDTPTVETATEGQAPPTTPVEKPSQDNKDTPPAEEADTPVPEGSVPVPTDAQQQAAMELLSAPPAPAAPAADTPPTLPTGGLRMGSIVPQEDPASVGDAPPPGANSVELRGLRSPKLPKALPMDIDGKLKTAP